MILCQHVLSFLLTFDTFKVLTDSLVGNHSLRLGSRGELDKSKERTRRDGLGRYLETGSDGSGWYPAGTRVNKRRDIFVNMLLCFDKVILVNSPKSYMSINITRVTRCMIIFT